MHMMMFGAVHVILLAVVSFFVLFAASKADGFVKLLGNILGYLLLLLAVLALACHVLMATGVLPHGSFAPDRMHWMMKDAAPVQPAPVQPAPAQPAQKN